MPAVCPQGIRPGRLSAPDAGSVTRKVGQRLWLEAGRMAFERVRLGMMRAARGEVAFYEQVEHDPASTRDALTVVLIASAAGAVGAFLGQLFRGHIAAAFGSLIAQAVVGVVLFYIWAFLVFLVGTNLFKGTADFGEVQRSLGFAWAPRVLDILGWLPLLGGLIGFVAWVWSVAIGFVAVRQALDLSDRDALLTVIISAGVAAVIGLIFGFILALFGLAGAMLSGAIG